MTWRWFNNLLCRLGLHDWRRMDGTCANPECDAWDEYAGGPRPSGKPCPTPELCDEVGSCARVEISGERCGS